MFRALAHHYVFVFYLLLNFLLLSPVWYGAKCLADHLEDSGQAQGFVWAIRIFHGLVFVLITALALRMSHENVWEQKTFWGTFRDGWLHVWVCLACLPIVGRLFEFTRTSRGSVDEDANKEIAAKRVVKFRVAKAAKDAILGAKK